MSTDEKSIFFLELGQIIQINAPSNNDIHEHVFLIEYLDENIIKLINNLDLSLLELKLEDKKLTDKSIEAIYILAKPGEKGYARQNDLIPQKWISIFFGGNVPTIINGQITNLEEDMIEITTYPSKKVIYIDFEYKGIPENLPILSIKPFIPPVNKEEDKPEEEEEFIQFIEDDQDDDLELIIDTEELNEKIKDIFIDLSDIIIGEEDLGAITEHVEVNESQKRFGIEAQTNDLLDELLSSIPTNQRTSKILRNIHIVIERFKQLRSKFSQFDNEGNAEKIKKKGANYKPLLKRLQNLNKNLYWIMPIARNKHKIYDIDLDDEIEMHDDITKVSFKYSMVDEMEFRQQYKIDTVPDEANKYNFLYRHIDNFYTPFDNTDDTSNIIVIQQVKENINVLIDNLDDFYSTMVENDYLVKERFIIDKYNLGLTRLYNNDIRNKKSKNEITPLTLNNQLALRGFLLLPYPFLQYSHINLPATSILEKVNLHQNNFMYSNFFTENIIFEKTTLNEDQKHINKLDNYHEFKEFRIFDFNETRKYVDRNEDKMVYENFLDNMIPKTKKIFEIIKKYIKNGISYLRIIDYLEPFLIYQDDITYKQYQIIVNFINEEIMNYKRRLIQNTALFTKYLKANKSHIEGSILLNLIEPSEQSKIFNKSGYHFNDDISTEISLKKIIDCDNGCAFYANISLSQIDMAQPKDIDQAIEKEINETSSKLEKKEGNDCDELILAKKYIDLEEIQADNNTVTLFDEKYDDTPYDIGDEWLEKNTHIEDADDKINALAAFLIDNNGIKPIKAKRDAESMFYRVKKVVDGDYAILDLGDADFKYYIRENNKWKLDRNLNGKNPEEILFCNIKKNCIKIKNTCTNIDTGKELLKKDLLEEISKRFEDELKIESSKLKQEITHNYNYRIKNLSNLKKMKIQKIIKNDLLKIKIGQTLDSTDIIISPYETLRDRILGQVDVVKKYNDILIFIERFCREDDINNDDESPHWYYCIDTSVPLLPTFFNQLAKGFNLQTYKQTISIIKKERGQLSDDGGRWIDKYSGYYICDIEYDNSEGYDSAGFKIVSRDILVESEGDMLTSIKEEKFNYKTELSRKIQKILKSLDGFLHISTSHDIDFIIRLTTESLNKYMKDEKLYRAMVKRAESRKQKKKKPYEKAYDEIFIFSLISAYIISVQTSIPNIISNITYPTCKKSFAGFPIDNNNDLSFLQYITCILFDIRINDRPWNIIPRANKSQKNKKMDSFVDKLNKFIKDKILKFDFVLNKINHKRVWVQENTNKDVKIVSEYNIQKWDTFLPALKSIKVTKLSRIPIRNFNTKLKALILKGDFTQFNHIWTLYGKMVSYSFAIQEAVQRAINKEPLLLVSKGGLPFLENSCCNEGNPNTNLYFSEKETDMKTHNKIVEDLSDIYYHYKRLIKSSIINFNINEQEKFSSIDKVFSKNTIYLSFIKFCKFNSGIILDENLTRICSKNSSNFKNTDTLIKKIEIMEEEGLLYSKDSLNILLNIINKKNIINCDIDSEIITEKLYFEKIIEHLISKSETLQICDPKLLLDLQNVLDRFDITIEEGADDIILNDLNTNLEQLIFNNKEYFIENMKTSGVLTKNIQDLIYEYDGEISKIKRKQKFILNWELQGDNVYMHKIDSTCFTIFSLLKRMVNNICKIYPTMILNKINMDKRYIPSHWKISEKHKKDIMKIMLKDHSSFKTFYNNKKLEPILEYIIKQSDDLILFINSIPFFSPILGKQNYSSIFDGVLIKNLGYYALLCAFNIYILAIDSDFQVEESDDENEIGTEFEQGTNLAILRGYREEIKKTVCSLLVVYLKKFDKYKKLLNFNSEQIMKAVLKSKEKEKSKITTRLKDLTIEEREIENIMKNHSLGSWGLGKTKAIYQYDDKQYDKERDQLEISQLRALGLTDENTELDIWEEDNITTRISNEINNLSHLPEDDDFQDNDDVDYS